jgi:hypothetical protein
MSKRELIDAILQHNRTAAPEFLAKFAESELKAYLERVLQIQMERMKNVQGCFNFPRPYAVAS